MWSSMIFWTLEVTFIDWDPLGPLGPFKQHNSLQIKSDWSISLQLQGLQTSAMAAAFVQQLLSLHFDDLFSLRLQSPPSKQCLLYLFQCISWWPNTKWEMPNSLLPFLWVAIQKEVQLGYLFSFQIATLKKGKQIIWYFQFGFWSPNWWNKTNIIIQEWVAYSISPAIKIWITHSFVNLSIIFLWEETNCWCAMTFGWVQLKLVHCTNIAN